MGEFTKDPGGHRVTDPGGGGWDYKEEPGTGWKVISDPGGGYMKDPGTGI
ncbi:hypothetical protein [Bacillus toyonensis]|nr:hypothetical protein [Bacillus toyonensis]